jgi:hypothetical protein
MPRSQRTARASPGVPACLIFRDSSFDVIRSVRSKRKMRAGAVVGVGWTEMKRRDARGLRR